mgnify:CR=1 FL=1
MRKRRTFKPEFKARVVLEELTGVKTAGQICREHQLSPQVFARWKAEFVERFDRHRGASDARRIMRRAREGDALVFFPEGTFQAEPGLMRFRTGAFAAAGFSVAGDGAGLQSLVDP